MIMSMSINQHFSPCRLLQFALPSIIMMMFMSLYTIVDGIFISRFIGSNALSSLNIVFPVICIVTAIGTMLATGGNAIISKYLGEGKRREAKECLTMFVVIGVAVSIVVLIFTHLFLTPVCYFLGSNEVLLADCEKYLATAISFAPACMLQSLFQSYLVTAEKPHLGLFLTIGAGILNAFLDYFLIAVCRLGMTGAALATATAPLVGMSILSMHFWKKKNQFHLVKTRIHLKTAVDICRLGVSSLVAELSSGIVILVFNMLTLKFSGTTGLAAYSILANIALVLVAIFTGIGQGIQPIVSSHPGKNGAPVRHQVRRYALSTAVLMALIAYLVVFVFAVPIADLFNKDKDPLLTSMAAEGMRIYFVSLFFSGINMVSATYLSASDQPVPGFIISILRGLVLILPIAFLLAALFGMTGIWLCLPVTEAIVCIVTFFFLRKF